MVGGPKSKMTRIEKKKKKIAAFLAIAKLNDADREEKAKINGLKAEIDSFDSNTSGIQDGPSPKKLKEDQLLEPNLPVEQEAEKCITQNSNLSSDDIDELRKAYRERKKNLQKLPMFRLKESGELASLYIAEDHRIPLFMVDVQHLLMYSLLGHHAPFAASRWYQLLKFNRLSHTVVLVVDDVSLEDLRSATGILHLPPTPVDGVVSSSFDSKSGKLFTWRLELVGPSTYGSNLIQEMATVPLSNTQYDKLIKSFGSLEEAMKGKAVYKVFRSMFPIQEFGKEKKIDGEVKAKDKFLRTQLLLSANQMLQMGYPLPLMKCSYPDSPKQPVINPVDDEKHADSLGKLIQSPEFRKNFDDEQLEEKSSNGIDAAAGKPVMDKETSDNEMEDEELYVFSRPWYKEVGPDSPLLAVDCEMCQTGKQRLELTRISVVNEDLKVVYESYVKPHRKITNYLTRFSGITPGILKDVKTRLIDVQRDLRKLLPPDAILVGQSLNFDLHAMKVMHPYVIDTSIAFNLTGERLRRTKLATLSRLFLSEDIQCWGSKGHDSIEDAMAAMKLILLKLSKNIIFGDAVLEGQLALEVRSKNMRESNRQWRLGKDFGNEADPRGRTYATSIFSHVKRGQHTAVVVGVKDVIKEYQKYVEGLSNESNGVDDETLQGERTSKLLPVEHSSEAITRACEVMLDHQLCMVHVTRDSVGERLVKLEKWCKKIVKYAAPNSLFIVVLGGAQSVNGSCMIHLKRPIDASI